MQLHLYYEIVDQGGNQEISVGTTDYRHQTTLDLWRSLAREFLAQYLSLSVSAAVVETYEKIDWHSEFLAEEAIPFITIPSASQFFKLVMLPVNASQWRHLSDALVGSDGCGLQWNGPAGQSGAVRELLEKAAATLNLELLLQGP